jgi:hypothetical protein
MTIPGRSWTMQDESFGQGAWEMIVTGSDKREVFRIPFPRAGELGR